MDFQQTRYSIETIVQRIRIGRLALPDFQREFVWNPGQVVELLDSVSRQWPIGTLLLLSGPQPFAFRGVDSGPSLDDKELDLYVLDGQQRVTALFHAFADVSDSVYYIDIDALLREDSEVIKWDRRSRFTRNYPTIQSRAEAHVVLVREIWDSESFFEWMSHLSDDLAKAQVLSLRDKRLAGLNPKVYHAMALLLDQSIDLEALARIFETINRTGVSLNAFDLLVAKLYPTGFNLRDEWDKAIDTFDLFKLYRPDEVEPLKLIALLVRAVEGKEYSKGVRQGDLLALDRKHIQAYWHEALSLYADSLSYCRKNFGVTAPELVPSWSMLLGVAGWLRYGDAGSIELWWQQCILNQVFAQAANTQIVSEFDAHFTASLSFSGAFHLPSASEWLDKPAKANGLFMRGLCGLMVADGAIDLVTGEPLSLAKSIAFRALRSDGSLTRLTTKDHLEAVLILSADSDRYMSRAGNGRGAPKWEEALASQGFLGALVRDPEFTDALFRKRREFV